MYLIVNVNDISYLKNRYDLLCKTVDEFDYYVKIDKFINLIGLKVSYLTRKYAIERMKHIYGEGYIIFELLNEIKTSSKDIKMIYNLPLKHIEKLEKIGFVNVIEPDLLFVD